MESPYRLVLTHFSTGYIIAWFSSGLNTRPAFGVGMAERMFNMRLESAEEAEQTCAEKLYMFLYHAKAHHRASDLSQVFNADFPFENIIETHRLYLEERQSEYADRVSANGVMLDGELYVHLSDFSADAAVKRRINRCVEKMPNFASRAEEKCPMHSKRCRLLRFNYGLLCFLHLHAEDSEPETSQLPSAVAPFEDEGGDEEFAFNPAEERALVLSSSLPFEEIALAITPTEDSQDNLQGNLPLSCFPSFPMVDDLQYVLLIDIMHEFNIREDYCLAAIANFSEVDMDWVVEGSDHHLLVDSAVKDSEYKSGKEILKAVFDEWKTCELPSEEEHVAATNRLGLADMGKFHQPTLHDDSDWKTSSLWTRSRLEADENQQVFVYEDDFLRRAGGSRSSAPSSSNSTGVRKDAALAQYVKKFHHQKIIIFHKEYSEDNAKFPLFAFKVLSRFLGGNGIAFNVEKVILVEKQFALRIFGQGPGCQALRSSYYLSYSAGAIAAGIKDPDTLTIYGKRDLIRSKKGRSIEQAAIPRIEELPTEEEHEEEGRPQKRIKPASPSNPSSPNLES